MAPDVWSLLTGLASIISLVLALNESFANWRKYSLPVTTAFLGFTVGRLSPAVSSEGAGFFLVLLILLSAVIGITFWMLKHEQPYMAYFLAYISLMIAVPHFLDIYVEAHPKIPSGDLIQLAQLKETTGDFENSIRYFELYRDSPSGKKMASEIDKKIEDIRAKVLVSP